MEGDLSLLSIPDLLQLICLGGYSRDIHLFDGAVQLGLIAVRRGSVARCFAPGISGDAAFFQLVQLTRGRYKVNEAHDTAVFDASLAAYSWQELLLEAARREDEAAHLAQAPAQSPAATGRMMAFPAASGTAPVVKPAATPPPALVPPPIPPLPIPPLPPLGFRRKQP